MIDEDKLTPNGRRANVIRAPNEPREFTMDISFHWAEGAAKNDMAFKHIYTMYVIDRAERENGHHPSLDDIFTYEAEILAPEALVDSMAFLMDRGMLYWYEEDGQTYYILVNDFDRYEPEESA